MESQTIDAGGAKIGAGSTSEELLGEPWVQPHPPHESDPAEWAKDHPILDASPDAYLDELVRTAARELDMPISCLNLVESPNQRTPFAADFPIGVSAPRAMEFWAQAMKNPGCITIVPDASRDPRFSSNPMVTGEAHIRFYAGAPMTDVDGRLLGALSVMDRKPRQLDAGSRARLSFLASVASSRIELNRLNAALRESEAHYRSAVDLNPQIPWTATPIGDVEEASPRWLDLTGMSQESARGTGWIEALYPDDIAVTVSAWNAALAGGQQFDHEYRLRTRSGTYRWFRVRAAPRRGANQQIMRWYGTAEDIHDKKIAETALRESEQRLRLALEVGGLGAWEFEASSGQVTASDLCAKAFGLARGEDLRDYETVLATLHEDDRQVLDSERARVFSSDHSMDVELRTRWADGSAHWVRLTGRAVYEADGQPRRAFGLAIDVTCQREAKNERERAQERLVHLANHDALTDLANRRLLDVRLAEAIGIATENSQAALLCVDLDHFKIVNDRLGHEAGDELLRQVAVRLRGCIRPGDTVARYGGDEFAIVMPPMARAEQVDAMAARVLDAFSEPFRLEKGVAALGATIGISLAPRDSKEPAQLTRNADSALYRAKLAGRGTCRYFDPGIDVGLQSRELLKGELQNALALGQLSLFYQPVVDLATGRISGFEALMRWNHPERGMISPDEFIPVAEESGLVVRLGRWALRQACHDAGKWPPHVNVAVNLSVVQFNDGQLQAEVAEALAAAGLPSSRLELEVTERLLLQDSESNLRLLEALRLLGVRLVMDDFGTGYSSLAYLRRFKFDKIKVDKSLVKGLPDSNGGDTIVKAIIALGNSLGIAITAEGIENPAQLAFLRQNPCEQGQGFFFSQPLPFAQATALLQRTWLG